MNADNLIRALVFAGGVLISGICAYLLYFLASLIVSGALTENWLMVIAGGLLLYLFMGGLAAGFIIGLFIIAASIGS